MAADYMRWNAEGNVGIDGDALVDVLPTVETMVRAQAFDFFGEPSIVGTPADAIALIEDHLTRGRLTDFAGMIALPGIAPADIGSSMELFARAVIPYFRGA